MAPVSATLATWAPNVSVKKERTGTSTKTCVGRLRASPYVAGEGNVAATSAPVMRVSLGRSTAPSVNVTIFPVPETKESSVQVMGNATVGSANAMLATSGTTVTALQRRKRVSPTMARSAVAEGIARVEGASARSLGPLERHVRSVQPAQMPAAQREIVWSVCYLTQGDWLTTRRAKSIAGMKSSHAWIQSQKMTRKLSCVSTKLPRTVS